MLSVVALNFVILNVVMLNAIILNAIILNVVAPKLYQNYPLHQRQKKQLNDGETWTLR